MRNLNRVHLNGLRAVETVGRLGNLRSAADELGVTTGAVSQQVQKAESQLGQPLFHRLPRGLEPTPAGQVVLARLENGFRELSAAVALAGQRDENVLTVSVAPVFAGKWLVWRLHRFNEQNPDIRLRIDANNALVDPDVTDVDLCIRITRRGQTGPNTEKMLEHKVFPVCSPEMARLIDQPADLSRVPIIRDPGAMFSWNDWLNPNGLDESVLGDGPEFSDASLCLDAAIAGQGVFLAWETLANDGVRAGRLSAPLPGRFRTELCYWFVTAAAASGNAHIRVFKDWIRAELAESVG